MTPKIINLREAITIPGTKMNGVITIDLITKHFKTILTLGPEGVLVESAGKQALIPMHNIKLIIFGEDNESK